MSFPLQQIAAALRRHFVNVRVIEPNGRRPTAQSERLFSLLGLVESPLFTETV